MKKILFLLLTLILLFGCTNNSSLNQNNNEQRTLSNIDLATIEKFQEKFLLVSEETDKEGTYSLLSEDESYGAFIYQTSSLIDARAVFIQSMDRYKNLGTILSSNIGTNFDYCELDIQENQFYLFRNRGTDVVLFGLKGREKAVEDMLDFLQYNLIKEECDKDDYDPVYYSPEDVYNVLKDYGFDNFEKDDYVEESGEVNYYIYSESDDKGAINISEELSDVFSEIILEKYKDFFIEEAGTSGAELDYDTDYIIRYGVNDEDYGYIVLKKGNLIITASCVDSRFDELIDIIKLIKDR